MGCSMANHQAEIQAKILIPTVSRVGKMTVHFFNLLHHSSWKLISSNYAERLGVKAQSCPGWFTIQPLYWFQLVLHWWERYSFIETSKTKHHVFTIDLQRKSFQFEHIGADEAVSCCIEIKSEPNFEQFFSCILFFST